MNTEHILLLKTMNLTWIKFVFLILILLDLDVYICILYFLRYIFLNGVYFPRYTFLSGKCGHSCIMMNYCSLHMYKQLVTQINPLKIG